MSCTTIMHINPGKTVEEGAVFSNAWGSAPYVWDALTKTYLPHKYTFLSDDMSDLWALWRDNRIDLRYRAVLVMTFDLAYVLQKDFHRAAEDIRAFMERFRVDPPGQVVHWFTFADYFEKMEQAVDVPAIGFHQTSVSENPWYGDWDDEKDAYGDPPWEDTYDLYAALDEHDMESKMKYEVQFGERLERVTSYVIDAESLDDARDAYWALRDAGNLPESETVEYVMDTEVFVEKIDG